MRCFGPLALTLLASAAAFPAAAADPDLQPPTAVAGYADLDLSQTSDAVTMLRRIREAALEACGAGFGSLKEYRSAVAQSPCVHDGVAQAVADLNAPQVTRVWSRRTRITLAENAASR